MEEQGAAAEGKDGAPPDDAGPDDAALRRVLACGTTAGTASSGATVRGTEVAADPTNGLALEAAARRHDLLRAAPRSAEPVRLAATQRVTRAQHDLGPVMRSKATGRPCSVVTGYSRRPRNQMLVSRA